MEVRPEMTEESIQPASTCDFFGNARQTVLHVLHSWGGGIDFFAKDLQAGDKRRNHFFLKSHSRNNLPPFGKELCLYKNLDDQPLATWHLTAPIMDTDLYSSEALGILQSIIEKWTIGAIVVSSLIGHSLDVLKTGLPTALAIHDVYPFWPLLHDANSDDYSIEYLRRALVESETMNVFARHEADYWLAIRDELISTVLVNKITCISPSVFAKERVCRIDNRLKDANWLVVPHGIGLVARASEVHDVENSGNLKVLVPGHINGGKGELLLKELIPNLPDGIELVLLGSAHLSSHFIFENVMTIDHYRREELGDLVGTIRPDIAMLPSLVPETYGYVLSEMLQLGVPVICSNVGAYAERAQHLPGVTVVEPMAQSFLEALIDFRDNPELLSKQRESLPFVFPGLQEMANAWASALPANPPQWVFDFTEDPNIEAEVKMNLQLTHHAQLLKAVYATTEKNTQSRSEALDAINKQQSNIESLLESVNKQGLQLTALLAEQNQLTLALSSKNKEIAWLTSHADEMKNAFQEQALIVTAQAKSFRREIEQLQMESESRISVISELANEERINFNTQLSELQARLSAMNGELTDMQSKRVWRIIRFFR